MSMEKKALLIAVLGALIVTISANAIMYMAMGTGEESEADPLPAATPEEVPIGTPIQDIDEPTPSPAPKPTSLRSLSLAELKTHQARAADLTERQDYSMLSGPDEYVDYSEEIGSYNDRTIEFAFMCWGDSCPDNGAYFIRYKNVPKEQCAIIGGTIVEGYSGWGAMTYGGCSPIE